MSSKLFMFLEFTLLALVKHLENVPESDMKELIIPTGVPFVYELDDEMKVIGRYWAYQRKMFGQSRRH